MAAAKNPFIIGEAIHSSWQRTKQRFGYFVLLMFAAVIVTELPAAVASSLSSEISPMTALLSFLLSLLGVVASVVVSRGIIKVSIEEARKTNSTWRSFLAPWQEIGWYFLATIVYALIIFAGILLLIVPGIYWSIKYQYLIFLVVDKKMGIREAMAASAKMTDGVKWDLIGFSFVTSIINLLGFLALFVGLLMTIPATAIARAKVYDALLKRA